MQVGVVTGFSWQMLTFDGHWHSGEVCSSQMKPGFNCTGQITRMEAENVPVLLWPAYSPDTSSIEHVWDALDRHCFLVPANIQQLRTAIEEEWSNILQATINSWINSM